MTKNKASLAGDFEISIVPYGYDDISISVRSEAIERNQVLVGIKFKVNANLSTSLNLFLQNQKEYDWKLDYGPLVKLI